VTSVSKDYLKKYLLLPKDSQLTTRQIAKIVGISTVSVVNRLNKYGVSWLPGVGKQRFWSTAEVAQRVSEELQLPSRVYGNLQAPTPPRQALDWYTLNPADTAKLLKHVRHVIDTERVTMKQMAVAANITRATLWNWMSRKKVPTAHVAARLLKRWPMAEGEGLSSDCG